MKPIYKMYIAIAALALLTIGIIGGQVWSEHKIGRLESAVEAAKQAAVDSQRIADDKETEANIYKAKIDYLEQQIADFQMTARRQDEKLKTQTTNTARARADVERARNVRPVDTNAAELCAKLAGLGHPCE